MSSVRVVSACGTVTEEIEVLEMVREDEADPAAVALSAAEQPPPAAELESPAEECSWAGLFSFQDLRAVHQQLCSVNSQLEQCLPVFPEEPSGMWTVLFGGAPEMSEQEVDTLCYQLQVYLGHGLDTCGWKILSQVLFTETDDPEEYYESLSELRQKGYEEVLQRARKRIQEVRTLSRLRASLLASPRCRRLEPRSRLCAFGTLVFLGKQGERKGDLDLSPPSFLSEVGKTQAFLNLASETWINL